MSENKINSNMPKCSNIKKLVYPTTTICLEMNAQIPGNWLLQYQKKNTLMNNICMIHHGVIWTLLYDPNL